MEPVKTTAAHASHHAHRTDSKSARTPAGAAPEADAGGFMSMLAAMEQGDAQETGSGDLVVADADADALHSVPSDALPVLPANVDDPTRAPTDAATSDWLALLLDAQGAAAGVLLPTNQTAANMASWSEATAALGAHHRLQGAAGTALDTGLQRWLATDAGGAEGLLEAKTSRGKDALQALQNATDTDTGLALGQGWSADPDNTHAAQTVAMQKAMEPVAADRLAQTTTSAVAQAQQWLDRGLGAGGVAAERMLHRDQDQKDSPVLPLGQATTDASALWGAAPAAMSAATPLQSGFADQLTEQVAYWVNQKTQNAEFTLDRDGQPVGVSVSLNGLEAHITFRSDQAQTRDMLDASTAQLRDLMQQQGLSLAGVSVGAQNQPSQQFSDGEDTRGGGVSRARRAQVIAPLPSAADVARASRGVSGGAGQNRLDVFA